MIKTIDDNLLAIFNAMVKNRSDWEYVTDEQKIKFFFIINRNMSKIYPDLSILLNNKLVDKVNAMDIWFHFMRDKPYPKSFWSKVKKITSVDTDYDTNIILERFGINYNELKTLIRYNPDIVDEEVKFILSQENLK